MSRRQAASRIVVIALLGGAIGAGVAVAEPLTGFAVDPDPPIAGATTTFTADDACEGTVTCVWDFGDGSGGANGKVVTHTYGLPGPVTVSLTTDDTSEDVPPVTSTRPLTVLPAIVPNRPPTAAFSAAPVPALTSQVVQFDAAGSSDPDEGDTLTHAWDLDGDGTFEIGDEARPFRSYAQNGTVTATLRVTDPDGASAETSRQIQVVNRPPSVSVAAQPSAPLTADDVTFTASGLDPDGTIAGYAWDGDGDGQFDDGTGSALTRSFPQPGNQTVRVRVTDDDGAQATGGATIAVGNRLPTATFTHTAPVRGEPVDFTATAADPEGGALAYAWEIGGTTYSGPTARHVFQGGRSLSVLLRVTDVHGGSVDVSQVVIAGNLTPTASVSASTTTPLTGEQVLFTGTAADRDGTVSYAWDLDDDGEFDDATQSEAFREFAAPGRKVVRLRVTDDDGAAVTVEQEVIVQERPASAILSPQQPAPTNPTAAPTVRTFRPLLPFPVVRFAGALRPGGARLTLFTVTAPKGARIRVRCRGRGCPRTLALRAKGVTRIRKLQRTFRAGARIDVWVTRPNLIGKHVRITIRRGKPPKRTDNCMYPGARRPRACP